MVYGSDGWMAGRMDKRCVPPFILFVIRLDGLLEFAQSNFYFIAPTLQKKKPALKRGSMSRRCKGRARLPAATVHCPNDEGGDTT